MKLILCLEVSRTLSRRTIRIGRASRSPDELRAQACWQWRRLQCRLPLLLNANIFLKSPSPPPASDHTFFLTNSNSRIPGLHFVMKFERKILGSHSRLSTRLLSVFGILNFGSRIPKSCESSELQIPHSATRSAAHCPDELPELGLFWTRGTARLGLPAVAPLIMSTFLCF